MAKQTGEYKITGTYDDVTYYRMEGQYYARAKSSLKGSRVKRDPRFRRTMEWAQRLAMGSQLASKVYRSLPRGEQVYELFCRLKRAAIRGLKEGRSEGEVVAMLRALGAAGSSVNSRTQTIAGARKEQLPAARKAKAEYRHLVVSRECKLKIGNVRRETSNVRQESSCTLYTLHCLDDRQVMAVHNHMGKGL